MTPQEVIKTFMRALDTHGYTMNIQTSSDYNETNKQTIKEKIMNQAIAKSSPYQNIQEVVDEFISDCTKCNTEDPENGWETFLKDKCGIDLNNIDTGAITGSDANIVIGGETIGSGIEKNYNAVLPEYGNYYEPLSNSPQYIITGNNGWIIQTKAGNDTIISNGEDSISTSNGDNIIKIYGPRATIDAAEGNNNIYISGNTKSVIIFNYTSDTTILTGNVNAVKFEDDNSLMGYISPIENLTTSSSNFDIKNNDTDNYLNMEMITVYTGTDIITIDLSKAIVPSAPSIVGGFIIDNSTRDLAKFVSTNSEARMGQMVGHVASVYPHLMMWTVKNLTIRISDRILINGTTTQKLAEFNSFDDVGNDSSATFKNTFKNGEVVDEFTDTDTNNEYERYIVASLYKWWIKEALKASWEAYGYSFEDPDTTILFIDTHFNKTIGGSNAYASVSYNMYLTGATASLNLNINKDSYENLTNFADDNGSSSWYLDRTIVHEFVHGVMAAKTSFFTCLPLFIAEGTAELIHGIDDKRTYSIRALAQYPNHLKEAVSLEKDCNTLDFAYAGGYMFLRYFAKQTALKTQDALVPMQITPIVNLTSSEDDLTYYINGDNTTDIANTDSGNYIVGELSSNIYTPSDNFEEIINIKSDNIQINLSQSNNTVISDSCNNTININGGDSQYIDLSNGGNDLINIGMENSNINTNNHTIIIGGEDNTVKIWNGNKHDIIIKEGHTNLDMQGWFTDINISLSGGENDLIAIGSEHKVSIDSGDNTVYLYGTNNSIISGIGNDTIYQYNNSDGGNFYQFNTGNFIGENKIIGFKENDKLIFAEEHNIVYSDIQSVIPSNGTDPVQICIISVKDNDNDLGLVRIQTVEKEIFDPNKNVKIEKIINNIIEENVLHYPDSYDPFSTKDILIIPFNIQNTNLSNQELLKINFKVPDDYNNSNLFITKFKIKKDYKNDLLNIKFKIQKDYNQNDLLNINFKNQTQSIFDKNDLLNINFGVQKDYIKNNLLNINFKISKKYINYIYRNVENNIIINSDSLFITDIISTLKNKTNRYLHINKFYQNHLRRNVLITQNIFTDSYYSVNSLDHVICKTYVQRNIEKNVKNNVIIQMYFTKNINLYNYTYNNILLSNKINNNTIRNINKNFKNNYITKRILNENEKNIIFDIKRKINKNIITNYNIKCNILVNNILKNNSLIRNIKSLFITYYKNKRKILNNINMIIDIERSSIIKLKNDTIRSVFSYHNKIRSFVFDTRFQKKKRNKRGVI